MILVSVSGRMEAIRAMFKIRQTISPKSVLKPTSLAKSTIKANLQSKSSKSK
jgi:spartin